jgi:hypothetical protein
MLTKRTVILAKIEGTYGSDSTPTNSADAVAVWDFDPKINPDMKERGLSGADISPYPDVRGKTSCEFSFTIELKGSGTAGTAPRISPILRACGLPETIVSSTSVTYGVMAATQESCTIYGYVDGILYKFLGCAGDPELIFSNGEVIQIKCNMKSLYALPTDSAIVTPTYDTTEPLVCKGATFTFGSYAAIIEKLNIKLNNTVAERPDFNQTEGVKGFQISERNPEGSMTIEAILRATTNADFLSYFHSQTVKALSLSLGATAGNIVTVTAPKCYCGAPVVGDRDGIRTFEIPFKIRRNSGNDELSIALT